MRPSKGNELWQQDKQFIQFYDRDDFPIHAFESPWEIVDFKGWARNKTNYDIVYSELLRGLRNADHVTRMLGHWMTVYLIDKDEEI